MKQVLWGFMLSVLAISLAGCETVKGIGKDISNTSSAVQDRLSRK